jgi:hypothetical protein
MKQYIAPIAFIMAICFVAALAIRAADASIDAVASVASSTARAVHKMQKRDPAPYKTQAVAPSKPTEAQIKASWARYHAKVAQK